MSPRASNSLVSRLNRLIMVPPCFGHRMARNGTSIAHECIVQSRKDNRTPRFRGNLLIEIALPDDYFDIAHARVPVGAANTVIAANSIVIVGFRVSAIPVLGNRA